MKAHHNKGAERHPTPGPRPRLAPSYAVAQTFPCVSGRGTPVVVRPPSALDAAGTGPGRRLRRRTERPRLETRELRTKIEHGKRLNRADVPRLISSLLLHRSREPPRTTPSVSR